MCRTSSVVREHVATERTVEIEVIGHRDVTAVRERRRVEAARCFGRRTTAVDANIGQIETEQLAVLAGHRARQRDATAAQRTDRRPDPFQIGRAGIDLASRGL